jgi:hypothetical protein
MAIFGLSEIFGYPKDDMARAKRKKERGVNDELVGMYVERLKRAGRDRPDFELALADIRADKRLTAADVASIASGYNEGGKKPNSKAAALALISKRYVEIVRFHAKNKVAEKVRPW